MPEVDLGPQIRSLIDAQGPISLEEVIARSAHPSPRARRVGRREQVASALVAAVVGAVVLLAVTQTGSHHRPLGASIATAPSSSVSPPPSVSLPSTVEASAPPLPGCTLVDAKVGTPPPSYQAGDYWRCPATPAVARAVTGAAVPDPTLPSGYASAYQPIIMVAPGPVRSGVYQRAWTPGGVFSASGAPGAYIELRVHAQQPGGWGLGNRNAVSLSNGAEAAAATPLVLGPATDPATFFDQLTWTHAGLDYELETAGVAPQDVLTVANSLP